MHRNSQKRFYLKDHAYFITGVTQNRFPYFKEEIFCEVFLKNLKVCRGMKGFELYGWFLGFDHFHMLINPNDEFNISKIMQFLKRHVSRNINEIMNIESTPEGEIGQSRLQDKNEDLKSKIGEKNERLKILKSKFHQKHPKIIPFPKFQWQRSFHDHVIRDQKDFENHMKYIQYNPIKHKMPEGWRWGVFIFDLSIHSPLPSIHPTNSL